MFERFTTRDANTSDELLALFNSTFNLDFDTKNQISGSIICSVVPQDEVAEVFKSIKKVRIQGTGKNLRLA